MNLLYLIFILLVTTVCILTYIYSTKSTINFSNVEHINYYEEYNNSNVSTNTSSFNSSYKSILYWDTFHSDKTMTFGFGQEIFANCPINNCFTTNDKQLMPVEDFDAILFHGARYSMKLNGRPPKRTSKQKYIFFSWESAYNTYYEPEAIKNFYNWTMTFRQNSDIHYPYAVINKQNTSYTLPTEAFIKGKREKIAWFASNCHTEGARKRRKFVKGLQNFIPVHIYGGCGRLRCNDKIKCFKMLEEKYKFYLAFENSFCPDYVTEKLFNVLKLNVIPVVWGGADYTNIAPPNSVINARDFENVEKLADFLKEVDANTTMYLDYLKWKSDYVVEPSQEYALCQLCKKLNEPVKYSNYENVQQWYYNNCTTQME